MTIRYVNIDENKLLDHGFDYLIIDKGLKKSLLESKTDSKKIMLKRQINTIEQQINKINVPVLIIDFSKYPVRLMVIGILPGRL